MRAIALIGAALLLLIGCGPVSKPSGAATPSPPSSPAPGAGHSPQPSPILTPTATSCQLPLFIYDQATRTSEGLFVDVPSGATHQSPIGLGQYTGLPAYDYAVHRWVPTLPPLVAPDGSRYAYNDRSGLHVVDIRSGTDRVIADSDPASGFEALDFDSAGIYADRPFEGPGSPGGLWRLDPATGSATEIESSKRWRWIGHRYAFETQPNPTDPVAEQGGQVADTLYRLDLSTGNVEEWLHRRGVQLFGLGLDTRDRPLVAVSIEPAQIVTVTGRDTTQPMELGTTISFRFNSSFLADETGVWIAADQGVFRYTASEGARLLWSRPSNSVIATIVGGCH